MQPSNLWLPKDEGSMSGISYRGPVASLDSRPSFLSPRMYTPEIQQTHNLFQIIRGAVYQFVRPYHRAFQLFTPGELSIRRQGPSILTRYYKSTGPQGVQSRI